jgi:AcrR family transcriptional regulator
MSDASRSGDGDGSDVLRERVLDAAWSVFKEVGYENARVQDVVERARVSRRTVYEFFRDVEELRRAVANRVIERALADATALVADATVEDRLRAVLTMVLGRARDEPHLIRLIVDELKQRGGENVKPRQEMRAFFTGMLRDAFEADQAVGRIAAVPSEVVIRSLVAMTEGLAVWFMEDAPATSTSDAVDCILKMFRRMVPWLVPD